MKKLLIFLLLSSVTISNASEIIIKTSSNATQAEIDIYLNKKFKHLLSDFETDYLIQNRNLFSDKNTNNKLLSSTSEVQQFRNIFIVNYTSNIDPMLVSKKLWSDPNFEYAEKMPERYLQFVPNDSLFNNQYYLQNINIEGAFANHQGGDEVLVAIIDTGIEYEHPDLKDNIWQNEAESGLDENGNDKSSNGIDDDGNGYIDDFEGWDFVAGEGSEDNNPRPGNRHGTHVAGIVAASTNNTIGVSGVALNTKLVAIKIGPDNPNIRTVARGYEGILYSAIIGADIINCSWGGGGFSILESQIIESATNLGSIVIAAAGNDNSETAFYPAAYPNVVSVASTDLGDRKSGFSNYHTSVDISAPGSQIFNTVVNGEYAFLSGTSMASPVVAGVAAMVKQAYPNYSSRKLVEQMLATTYPVSNNDNYRGNLGSGIIDANEAVTNQNAKNVSLFNYSVRKQNGETIFQSGDELKIDFVLENILNPINNFEYKLIYDPEISIAETSTIEIGTFDINQKITDSESIVLPLELPLDYKYNLGLSVSGEDYNRDFNISFNVNQSYRNMFSDRLNLTVNSRGNLAFNDYPSNEEGIGFNYENMGNMLFEGGMMVSTSSQSISSVVRSESQGDQNKDFVPIEVANEEDLFYSTLISSKFTDNSAEGKAGVEITKDYLLAKSGELANVVYLRNNITNISGLNTDSLYVGYYFDWDIGPSGLDNIAEFWQEENLGIQYNANVDSLPYTAVGLISDGSFIVYPLDNDGSTDINPGVYDGFTRNEQWQAMTGAIKREKSSQTDASMVFSSGPYSLDSEQSREIIFVIMAADTKEEFPQLFQKAKDELGLLNVENNANNGENITFNTYPNPVQNGVLNIELINSTKSIASVKLFDIKGNLVLQSELELGSKSKTINTSNIINGSYVLEITNKDYRISKKIIVNNN